MVWENIEGWHNWGWLYEAFVKRGKGDAIEIGSWNGKSAIHLGELIKEAGTGQKVFCIDTYTKGLHGTDDFNAEGLEHLKKFKAYIHEAGLEEIVIPIVSTSTAVHFSGLFKGKTFELIYIDGDHTYGGCLADITNYIGYLSNTGVIAGHDYVEGTWQGVVDAVKEARKLYNVEFKLQLDTWYTEQKWLTKAVKEA